MSFVYPGVVPEPDPEEPPKPEEKLPEEEKATTWTQKVAALFTSKDDE